MLQNYPPLARLSVLALVLALPFLLAHSLRPVAGAPPQERELHDRIPKHVPIKVKVKNLNNEKWLRDLEIEVKNTGSKPIYFLRLGLYFIDVKRDSGDDIGYLLVYGRGALIDVGNHATPEDVPINPGETYTFKVHESNVEGWEYYRSQNDKPEPKKVGLRFDVLNFGDGTGFLGSDGTPLPQKIGACAGQQKPPNLIAADIYPRHPYRAEAQIKLTSEDLPAAFLPVNFFFA